MNIIDGRRISNSIIERLKQKPTPNKILAAILVGGDPSSLAFLKRKAKIAEELRIEFKLYELEEAITQEDLEKTVKRMNNDNRIGGVIIQLPLPKKFNRDRILYVLDISKDVDALKSDSVVEAPTVGVVKAIIDDLGLKIKDLGTIAVVGKGLLVGRPIINWLSNLQLLTSNFELKIADSKTENLAEFLKDANLVITGVGKSGLIKLEWLKEEVVVIDFGFPPDFSMEKSDSLNPQSGYYTPTPGGTGPILVAKLFDNFYKLNS